MLTPSTDALPTLVPYDEAMALLWGPPVVSRGEMMH
jgi:hypothetical protein